MDKRKKLQELEDKHEEFRKEISTLRGEVIDFEETEHFEKYKSYKEDIVKQEMYPKEHAIYKQIDEIQDKLDAFYNEILNSAIDLNKELNENIAKLESKVETNKQFLKELEEKINKLENEIKNLKDSEEYKKSDEATLLKVEELESELKSKVELKNKISTKVLDIEKELEKIKEEKQELIDAYGEEIEEESQIKDTENESKESQENTEAKGENKTNNSKDNKENDKTAKEKKTTTKKAATVVAVRPEVKTNNEEDKELSEEEKAKKEQLEKEEKEQKLKEEFKGLYAKAKKGKLTQKETDSLIDIMKNKENYEKLGITTGLFFNKSRGIFDALNEKTKDDETRSEAVKEAYKVYEEIFFEKHSEKKLNMFSKIFEISEVEYKKQTQALPEAKVESKKSVLEDIREKVADEPQEVAPKAPSNETISKEEI